MDKQKDLGRRRRRKARSVRRKILRRGDRPRLVVFRSNKNIYAQVIDDRQGRTLAQASSREANLGAAAEGLARSDFVFSEDGAERLELGHWGHRPIHAADPADPRNALTVRDAPDAPRQVIERAKWRFTEGRDAVALDGGFEKGRIYEVVYVARDPVVVGLGLVALRDFTAATRREVLSDPAPLDPVSLSR